MPTVAGFLMVFPHRDLPLADEFECKPCCCRRVAGSVALVMESFVGFDVDVDVAAVAVVVVRTVRMCDPGFGSVCVTLGSRR